MPEQTPAIGGTAVHAGAHPGDERASSATSSSMRSRSRSRSRGKARAGAGTAERAGAGVFAGAGACEVSGQHRVGAGRQPLAGKVREMTLTRKKPDLWNIGPVITQCRVVRAWAGQLKVPHNPPPSVVPAHPGPLTPPTPPAAPISLGYSMGVTPYPFYRVGCHIHALASQLPPQVMVRTRRR
jgi:hypothetical protein